MKQQQQLNEKTEISIDYYNTSEYFAIKVESFELPSLNIHKGTVLIVKKTTSQEINNNDVVICAYSGRMLISRCFIDGELISLYSNINHQETVTTLKQEDCIILGRVVEVRNYLK